MIQRLKLRRWRAFDSIDLGFERGTTFVVAPNGVGKTSLLLGLAWAIFGEQSKVDARECIRAGASSAEAEVALVLEDGRRLLIRRTISEKGKPTTDHELDGQPLTEDALLTLLHQKFGAEPGVAAQLSMMVGGGHVASERALNLEDHLYQAFGVSQLRIAAEQASAIAKAAVKHRETLRSVAKQGLVDRSAQETELARLEQAVQDMQQQREALASALESANHTRDVAAAWHLYEAQRSRRQEAVADVMATARELALDQDASGLPAALDAATSGIRAELAEIAEHITDTRARARAAQSAIAMLDADDPSCPTCLRPFHGGELDQALLAQRNDADAAVAEEDRWRQAAAGLEQRLARLDKFRQELSQLPPEPSQPADPPFDGDPDAAVAAALGALQDHDTRAGRVAHEREVIARALSDDDDQLRAGEAQQLAYRNEAVTRAASTALADAADQLTRGYIEPLSEQIKWKWKALFGEEGLQLKPNGTIVRVVGDRELPWDSLSGGERIWARLVTHLLVLATSTRLPFAWFDEPLEHLDPRARRAVAAALATATRTGGPQQLIVTTYEHAIARQLAADVPEAAIRYVRRSVR